MDPSRYRADIDGLRSIAVLSVLLFHFDLAGVKGGFVGVDVFFVISGFLITRLIVDELEQTGSFSFSRFYTRRIRRLFPAMLSTYLASLVAAILLFSPEQLDLACASMLYALLSLSNVLFWLQADYFDVAAQVKPLLHTWSLSVEEQFYLVWPLTLVFLIGKAPRWLLAPALMLIGLASLAVAQVLLRIDPSGAFYLLPPRVFEFLFGGAVVWLGRHRVTSGVREDLLLAVGLGLIIGPMLLLTPETPFPGLAAAVPCLGAALSIYAGRAPYVGKVMRNPIAVAIGRWSYSIYLVHWPILVFYSAYTFAELTLAEKIVLLAVAVVAGWLQYRLIEERFRHVRKDSWTARQFVTSIALLAVAVGAPSEAIRRSDGWSWRLPQVRNMPTATQSRRAEEGRYCQQTDPSKPADLFTCQNYRQKDRDIIVWGDSHAMHLIAGISEAYPEHNVYILYLAGCIPQSGFAGYTRNLPKGISATQPCIDRNHKALAFLEAYKPSTIILSNAKRATPTRIAPVTNLILERLTAAGHNAFVLGDLVRPGRHLANCVSVPDWLIGDEQLRARCVGKKSTMQAELKYNRVLAKAVQPFIDPEPIQCPAGVCQFYERSSVLFRDEHHLSTQGSIYFVGRLKDKLPIPP